MEPAISASEPSPARPVQQPISIAVAAVLRRAPGAAQGSWLVLICRRPAHAVRGGLWEFPGGKTEVGESPAGAAARELAEETGLQADPARGAVILEHEHHEPAVKAEPWLKFTVVAFVLDQAATSDQPEPAQPRPLGCAECRWEVLDALDNYRWPTANRHFIVALREFARALPPQPS